MNRKDFFKRLGIGALAVIVAPKILAEVKEELPKGTLLHEDGTIVTHDELFINSQWHVPTKDDIINMEWQCKDFKRIEIFTSEDGITWKLDKEKTRLANL